MKKTDTTLSSSQSALEAALGLEALEPRILLDAAVMATGAEALDMAMDAEVSAALEPMFLGLAPVDETLLSAPGAPFADVGQGKSDIVPIAEVPIYEPLDPSSAAALALTDPQVLLGTDAGGFATLSMDDASMDAATYADEVLAEKPGLTPISELPSANFQEKAEVTPIAEIQDKDAIVPISEQPSVDIVFIDGSVSGFEQIVDSVPAGFEIVIVSADEDGVQVMADTLAGRSDVTSIHIVSHGEPGQFTLGRSTVDAASLAGEHAGLFAQMGEAFTGAGDILIYGCNFGQDNAVLNALSDLTGTDVAASIDDTGAALVGGDWVLEARTGKIEATALNAAAFTGILADTDGDGVDDSVDIDDDNDGILDSAEGATVINGFTIGTTVLTENGDGSGSFLIPVLDSLGNQVGSLTLDYTGFNGDGGNGGNGSNSYTPTLNVGQVGSDVAIQLIYAVPDVNGHNFSYSITSNGLDFTDAEHNVQGQALSGGGQPGRVESGVFTIDHTLANDPTALLNGGTVHTIGGTGIVAGQSLNDGDAITRISGRNANRLLNIGFDIGNGETYGVDVAHNSQRPEGIEVTTFVLGTSVSAVGGVDSDGDGVFDHLDLDSDNDGIPDNIEAQTTAGYVAPNADDPATYTANNGLNSAYVGTNGLTPVNTDGDVDADYLDTDSDNEGGSDAAESGIGATTVATGLSNAGTDADGDGLFDVFEDGTASDGYNINDGQTLAAFADSDSDAGTGTPLTADVDFRDAQLDAQPVPIVPVDTDGDGIDDIVDIDDDDDGILDVNELATVRYSTEAGDLNPSSGYGGFNVFDGPTAGLEATEGNEFYHFNANTAASRGTLFTDLGAVTLPGTYTLSVDVGSFTNQQFLDNFTAGLTVGGVSGDAPGTLIASQIAVTPTPAQGTFETFTFTIEIPEGDPLLGQNIGFQFTVDPGTNTNGAIDNIRLTRPVDTDSDGVADHLDIDSDNDGLQDAAEQGGNIVSPAFAMTNAQPAGAVLGDAAATADGVVNASGSTNGFVYDTVNGPFNPTFEYSLTVPVGEVVTTAQLFSAVGSDPREGLRSYEIEVRDSGGAVVFTGSASSDTVVGVGQSLDIGGLRLTSGNYTVVLTDRDTPRTNREFSELQFRSINDTDEDGLFDHRDLDSDDDGIGDTIEGRATAGYIDNPGSAGADADEDGYLDLFDSDDVNFGSDQAIIVDTDDDGTADYRDLDSDGDGISDTVESGLTQSGVDANMDGIDDDASIGASYANPDGSNPDPLNDLTNADSDPTLPDFRSVQDTDGDGVADVDDLDDDNDGILDVNEGQGASGLELASSPAQEYESTRVFDTPDQGDGDSEIYNLEGQDGQTIDLIATIVSSSSADGVSFRGTTGGSVGSLIDANTTATIRYDAVLTGTNTPQEFSAVVAVGDIDGPGNATTSSTRTESFTINISEIYGYALSPTSTVEVTDNGDGTLTFTGTVQVSGSDPDGKVFFALRDTSSFSVTYDNTPTTGNGAAGFSLNFADTPTTQEFVYVGEATDTDGDGIANHLDLDSDNDGISDLEESGSGGLDANNDGVLDAMATPALQSANDLDDDGLLDSLDNGNEVTPRQTADGDGVADYLDLDSDGDGIADAIEARPTSAGNVITVGGDAGDNDGDGVLDHFDTDSGFGGTFTAPVNTDAAIGNNADGLADYIDTDSDGDGTLDSAESGLTGLPADVTFADADGTFVPSTGLSNEVGDTSEVAYREIDTPTIIDLNDDNSTADLNSSYSYSEGDGTVNVIPVTADVIDAGNNITSVSIELAGFADGTDETLTVGGVAFVPGTNSSGTATLGGVPVTLSLVGSTLTVAASDGTSTLDQAALDGLLRGASYSHSSDAPTDGNRTLTFSATDSSGNTTAMDAVATIAVASVNDAPVTALAVANQSGSDGAAIAPLDVTPAFDDPDGDTLSYSVSGLPAGLSIDMTTGLITGTTAADASQGGPANDGVYSVTVTATDPDGLSVDTNFTYTLTNPAPVVDTPIGAQAAEDGDVVSFTPAITDPDGDTLSYTATGLPMGLSIDGMTGEISGTLDNSASQVNGGVHMITVTADDGEGGTVTDSFTLTVTNPVPDAIDDLITTPEDTAVEVVVRGNDADPDGDDLTVTAVTQGTNGSVTIDATSGNPVYTPNADFNGTDTFTYTISDGEGGTDTATVMVTVDPVQDAPVAVDDVESITEDDTVSDSVLSANVNAADSDADGDTLTVTMIDGAPFTPGTQLTLPSGALLTMRADGSYDYDTNGAFDGLSDGDSVTDSFTYTIDDGNGGTDTARVDINISGVNDAPIAEANARTITEDQTAAETGNVIADDNGLGVDSDLEGDSLTVSDVDGTPVVADTVITGTYGTLTIQPDGSYSYQLDTTNVQAFQTAQTETDSFTYTINDGNGGTDTATLEFSIDGQNDAPVAVADTETTDEETLVSGNALPNDSDIDGGPLVVTPQTGVAGSGGGVFSIDAAGMWSFDPNGEFERLGVGDSATTALTYQIDDGLGGTDTATVTITVTGVNDVPGVVDDTGTTQEDMPLTLNVLSNDSDLDGDTLTLDSVTQPPNGTVAIVGGQLVYTPNANFKGTDSFTYTVDDGNGGTATATVSVTVEPVNDAPVAVDEAVTTSEDTPVTVDVLPNDADVDGDTLTVTDVTQGTNGTVAIVGGQLVYTPNADSNGEDIFTYTVDDGQGGTDVATVTVRIVSVNDVPVAVDDAVSTAEDTPIDIPVLNNDSDVDGDTLTVTAVTQGTNGSVAIDPVTGKPVYTPNADFNGTDSFTYTVDDGFGATAMATVTLTVDSVNDAPVVVTSVAQQISTEAMALTPVDVAALFDDIDGDTLRYGSPDAPAWITIDPNTGELTGTPPADASVSGPYTITLTATDPDGEVASTTVTFDVANPAPVVNNATADLSLLDGQTVSIATDFVDPDGDSLTYTAIGLPSGLSILPTTGEIVGTLDNSASQGGTDGVYSVIVTADDGQGGTVNQTIDITVTNPSPVATDDNFAANEGETITANVILGSDTDTDLDPDDLTALAFTGQAGDMGGLFSITADGTLTFDTNGEFEDLDVGETRVTSVSYEISDGEGGTDTATVFITVSGTNDAPVMTGPLVAQSGTDNAALTPYDVSGLFGDVDGEPLSYALQDAPSWLTIEPSTGVITGTPPADGSQGGANSDGVYALTVTVSDPDGESVSQQVIYSVSNTDVVAANDAFTIVEDGSVASNLITANDLDADSDSLTIDAVALPDGSALPIGSDVSLPEGTLRVNADGTFEFTAAPDYNGVLSFGYTVTDSQGSTDVATVTITVTPEPDAPRVIDPATGNDATDPNSALPEISGNDGQTLIDIPIAQVFREPDGQTLTYSLPDAPEWLSIDPDTGVISGTPPADASTGGPVNDGRYAVTVTATDPDGSSVSTVLNLELTNTVPDALADGVIETPEDTPVTIDVLGNDTDTDGDRLVVNQIDGQAVAPGDVVAVEGGEVTVNTDGTLTYTPGADYNGQPSFTYQVSDNEGGVNDATVTLAVQSVADAPVLSLDVAVETDHDSPAISPVAPGSFVSDVDSTEMSQITLTLTGPDDGEGETLTLGGVDVSVPVMTTVTVDGVAYNVVSDGRSVTVRPVDITAPVANVDAVLASLTYAHQSDAVTLGDRTVTITVTDETDVTSSEGEIVITVNEDVTSPEPPIVNPPVQEPEGPLTVTGTGEPGSTAKVTFPDGTTADVEVDSEGNFTATSETPQPDGDVTVVLCDPTGNESPPVTEPWVDEQAPLPPVITTIVQNPEGPLTITGEGEPGSTAKVAFPDGTIADVEVDSEGNWTATSDAPQPNGDVTVALRDPNGNDSPPVTEPWVDMQNPLPPVITTIVQNPEGPLTVTGEGEPDSTATVTFPDGSTVDVEVDSEGNWSATSETPQSSGDVSVVTTDENGNESEPDDGVFIDEQAPLPPTITSVVQQPEGPLTVTGRGEPGATAIVVFPDGSVVEVEIDADGNFAATSATPQSSGDVDVTSRDDDGNLSEQVTAPFVDSQAPLPPTIDTVVQGPGGQLTVTGTAEAGTVATVTFPDGSTVNVPVDENGNFVAVSETPQTSGGVTAVSTDDDGNVSDPAEGDFVDDRAPEVPAIATVATNDDANVVVTGTGEPGSTVTVTFPDGGMVDTLVGPDGLWTATSLSEQPDGDIVAVQMDEAGNLSDADRAPYVNTLLDRPIFSDAGIGKAILDAARGEMSGEPFANRLGDPDLTNRFDWELPEREDEARERAEQDTQFRGSDYMVDVPGAPLGEQIWIEAIAKGASITVEFASSTTGERTVDRWEVTQANGAPLPNGVQFVGDYIVIERPLNADALTLRVRALLENGQAITQSVSVDLRTATVKPVGEAVAAGQTLQEQMASLIARADAQDRPLQEAHSEARPYLDAAE